jgi:hypothetical protein
LRIHAAKIEESISNRPYSGKSSPAAVAFAHVLDQANALKNPGAGSDSVLQPVGVISREYPTVSDLLINNAQLSKDTWKIIHSERNTQKNYARMPPGTRVFIDRQTNELFWEAGDSAADSRTTAWETGQAAKPQLQKQAAKDRGADAAGAASEKSAAGPAAAELPAAGHVLAEPFSAKLAQAVQSDLGRPYREIDCYGLVVRGLSRMGVKYTGRGGLQDQLVQMAKSRGLPANAYMTGEGLVEASGEKVFTKSLNRVENVEKTAGRIFDEMAPLLQKGDILSFSTRTRGHTGVVSQHKEMWTFINSGYMDNRVDQTGRTKGVGEEDLAREIKNWCKVAARSGESLVVTVGRLQEEKLVAML